MAKKRPSSAKRGYDYAWRKFRASFLVKNPICCRQGCREPATDVDHEPPLTGKDDPGRLDPARCAPLCHSHHSEKTGKQTAANNYDEHRDDMAARSRKRSKAGRDIAPLPPVENPRRRKKAEKSLRYFLEVYFPDTFNIPWSDDQLLGIDDTERIIVNGGLKCFADPRGDGKTMRAVRAALWAVMTGRRKFVMKIAATKDLADNLIHIAGRELQFNELLAEDFPEVCYPIRELENEARRQAGQTLNGEHTLIRMTGGEIVFPTVKGSKASGAVIRAAGLTGAVKGQIMLTGDGKSLRPDLVLLDDPQTRDSAKSPTQNADRIALINGDVLGLAGPKRKIACVMNCTVIYRDDLCDKFLNQEINPTWNGRRAKLLYSMPKNIDLWDQYADIRRESFRQYKDNRDGNEFYLNNRAAMDEGAKPGWLHRYDEDEHSAIQNAMNLKIDKPLAFASEYQNDPEADALAAGAKELSAEAIAGRYSGLERWIVPQECGTITTFVDPSATVLWYLTAAWNERFGGSIIDYGCWPQQNRRHFAQADARPSLDHKYPGKDDGERVYAGLQDLVPELLGRRYFQDVTGGELKCGRLLIDAGWVTDAVYQYIRALNSAVVLPSKGVGRSRTSRGIAGWKVNPGEVRGHHWRRTISETKRGQMIQFDPDAWKSYAYDLLTKPLGGPAVLTIHGTKGSDHGLLSEHLSAEYSEPDISFGTWYDRWTKLPPGNRDNHWWDCLVGAAVGASVSGLKWAADVNYKAEVKGPKMKMSEKQAMKLREKGIVA